MAPADSSVILLSGGLDSAANLALACAHDRPVRLALTANYGQRAAKPELEAAAALCKYYGVEHQQISLPWLGRLGGSALTDFSRQLPMVNPGHLDDVQAGRASARAVWVPNRNGVLIEIAAAHAEALDARVILTGFNREEAATFPDNSRGFMDAISASLQFSTANGVRVQSYTVDWDKREIAQELNRLAKPFPWDLVWSCYTEGPHPCFICESCRRFQRARSGT